MTYTELRDQVISKIQITEDMDILEFVLGVLQQDIHTDEVYECSHEQNRRIDIALNQIEIGETYTQEEADKITREWIEK